MIIRQERPGDYVAVGQMVKSAFAGAEHSDGKEHELVARLRGSDGFIEQLSLVAQQDECIVGHIMFTVATVGETSVLALAPLSVHVDFQRKGIGGLLIEKGHEIAKGLGYDIIVVLGSEKYYPKFGYKPASLLGIKPPFEVPDANFMAVSLSGSAEMLDGTIEYVKQMLE